VANSRATSALLCFLLGDFVSPTRFGDTNVQEEVESLGFDYEI